MTDASTPPVTTTTEDDLVDLPAYVKPRRVVLFVLALLAIAWTVFIAVSGFDVFDTRDRVPAWELLFNHRPVEWMQWVFHVATSVAGAFVAGQLWRTRHRGLATFWGLMAVATGIFVLEDAGDIRHTFRDGFVDAFGERPLGIPNDLFTDVPYFALMALIPVYALVRYGRHAWSLRGVRPYLGAAIGVYMFIAIANALRGVGSYYERLGARFHQLLAGGELPPPEGWTLEELEFHLIDGPFEESFELLATGLLFAALMATVRALNRPRADQAVPGSADDRHPTPA